MSWAFSICCELLVGVTFVQVGKDFILLKIIQLRGGRCINKRKLGCGDQWGDIRDPRQI